MNAWEKTMNITLNDIIGMVKNLPEDAYETLFHCIEEIKDTIKTEASPVSCISCGGSHVVRNGKRHGRQAYRCMECGKTFVQTTNSPIAYSHSSEPVWKQIIRDTVDGVAISKTANTLDLSHSTVFYMRHKILLCVEQAIMQADSPLDGVCEADETYVLENEKGRKFPIGYHRKPRKHGAVASKRGISDEYICICTSVGNDNSCTATSVNRSIPTQNELNQVFGSKVNQKTVILCDGNKNYDVLDDKCTVAHPKRVNRVNGFHSFIKSRIAKARGVATVYMNRYNALFSEVYAKDEVVDKIYDLMVSRNGSFASVNDTKNRNLLKL